MRVESVVETASSALTAMVHLMEPRKSMTAVSVAVRTERRAAMASALAERKLMLVAYAGVAVAPAVVAMVFITAERRKMLAESAAEMESHAPDAMVFRIAGRT
jgi:hypothetical protein